MCLFLYLILLVIIKSSGQFPYFSENVHVLEAGIEYNRTNQQTILPEIFCYKGLSKNIIHLWETLQLQLSLEDNFDYFEGSSPEEVLYKFDEQKSSWNFFTFYTSKRRNIRLNPFNQTCIGVVSQKHYTVKLSRIRVDYWKLLWLAIGVGLFLYAPTLSKNTIFYYMTGISVGTCASFLILIYIFSRFFPRKPLMYTFLAGGWSVGLYICQLLYDNLKTIALEYKSHVTAYATATSLISFVVCYRYGPVSDPRTMNLIQWALQVVGLIFIFISSEFQEASIAIIIILLAAYNIPKVYIGWLMTIFFRMYVRQKPRRLLTDDEFHQEGAIETKKSLDRLRGYCSSPECKQWKMILRLKDPLRFAKFVEGASHLSDSEVLSFETNHRNHIFSEILTDDSESE